MDDPVASASARTDAAAALERAEDLPSLLRAVAALAFALPGVDPSASRLQIGADELQPQESCCCRRRLTVPITVARDRDEPLPVATLFLAVAADLDPSAEALLDAATAMLRALAEKAVRELLLRRRGQQLLAGLREAPSFELLVTEPDMHIVFATRETSRLLDADEGDALDEALPAVAEQGFWSLREHVLRTGRSFQGTQVPIHGLPGNVDEVAYYNLALKPWLDDRGETVGLLAQGVDVTELVQARQAYEAMNARLHELVDTVDAVVWELDPARERFNFVSGGGDRYGRGWARSVTPRQALAATVPEDRPLLLASLARAMQSDELVEFSYRARAPDHRREAPVIRWLYTRMHRVDAGETGGMVLRGVSVDVSERWEAERELARARQLQSLTLLARGAAHDFNNMVNAASLHVEEAIALTRAPPSSWSPEDARDRSLRHLELVMASLGRATQLTRRLRVFAGDAKPERHPLRLVDEIADMLPMLASLLPPEIDLRFDLGEVEAATILADPSQLQQVLMNLIINAGQAMAAGGTVIMRLDTVEAATIDFERASERGTIPDAGAILCLEVIDAGVGFPAGHLERAFEPFWSTRGPGRGLGLAIVAGVVRSHGWGLIVDSEPGRGTRFCLLIPPRPAAAAQATTDPASPPAATPGPAREQAPRLLLVEDEAVIRMSLRREFADAGFAVTEAVRTDEAIAAFCDRPQGWAGAFVDMQLPDTSGAALIEVLHDHDPQLPIVIMTGDCTPAVEALAARHRIQVLRKPFTLDRLRPLLSQIAERHEP